MKAIQEERLSDLAANLGGGQADNATDKVADTTPATSTPSTAADGHGGGQTYNAKQLAEVVGVDDSTIRNRWMPKLLDAFQYSPYDLRIVTRRTKAGNPVYEYTEAAKKAVERYAIATQDGTTQEFLDGIKAKYPAPPEAAPIVPEVVETANLAAYEFPQQQAPALSLTVNLYTQSDADADGEALAVQSGAIASLCQGVIAGFGQLGHSVGVAAGANFAAQMGEAASDGINKAIKGMAATISTQVQQ